MHVRGRYGHGGRLGYDREWRADAERSGGGELIDQGMHLLDLDPLARRARCRCTRRCCAPSSGTPGRGQRGARARRRRRAAPRRGRCSTSPGPSGRTCSRSRSTAGPRSSRSTGSCAPTAPRRSGSIGWARSSDRPSSRSARYGPRTVSWAAEWEHFAAALAGRRPAARGPRRRAVRLGAGARTPTRASRRYAPVRATSRPVARPEPLPPVCMLAGGLGTRLGEHGPRHPEAAARGRRASRSCCTSCGCCAATALERVVLCVGYLGERIEAAIGPERFGIEIAYSYDGPTPIGTLGRDPPGRPAARRALPRALRRHLSADRLRGPPRAPGSASGLPGADDGAAQRGPLGHLQRDASTATA